METQVSTRDKFSISDSLNRGWLIFRGKALLALGALMISIFVPVLLSVAGLLSEDKGLTPFFGLAHFIVTLILTSGVIKIYLLLIDGKDATISDFMMELRKVVNFALCYFLVGLIVGIGMLLFIIPGLIWFIQFYFAPYAVIDEGVGPIAALGRSSDLTRGSRWKLLGFALVVMLLNFLGASCFGIGLLVTIPVTLLSTAWVYRQLQAHTARIKAPSTVIEDLSP
jgi:uncharacterized membrane protein